MNRVSIVLLSLSFGLVGAGLFAAEPPAKLKNVVEELGAKLKPTRIVVYKTVGDRQLQLHLFEPAGHKPGDRRAIFVGIHGGGWAGGNPTRFYPYDEHFAKLGMLGASIEYRLISRQQGTTPFESVKDGRSAIRYIRSHAAELGVDPGRIVVSGGSAGGHVAAGTALFDGIDEPGEDTSVSCVPNAMVLYYPVIDTSSEGYGNARCGPRWQEISPVHRVKPGLPPTIIFHGTGDTVTPFAGAKSFYEQMTRLGNRCELVVHEGGRHGYMVFDRTLFDESLKRTDEFLSGLGYLASRGAGRR